MKKLVTWITVLFVIICFSGCTKLERVIEVLKEDDPINNESYQENHDKEDENENNNDSENNITDPVVIIDQGRTYNLTWTYDDKGILTISGEGNMENYSNDHSPPWKIYDKEITTLIIEEGARNIGSRAFSGLEKIESVIIPDTVTTIGSSAFSFCSSLKELVIPSSVTIISDFAFYYCYALTGEFVLPEGLKQLGEDAFVWTCINTLTIPSSVTSIGYSLQKPDYTIITPAGSYAEEYAIREGISYINS